MEWVGGSFHTASSTKEPRETLGRNLLALTAVGFSWSCLPEKMRSDQMKESASFPSFFSTSSLSCLIRTHQSHLHSPWDHHVYQNQSEALLTTFKRCSRRRTSRARRVLRVVWRSPPAVPPLSSRALGPAMCCGVSVYHSNSWDTTPATCDVNNLW